MAKITFKNITKMFGDFSAVKDLNLEVEDQEFVCLVGPSGCGKTTTLRMLAGLEEITKGTISIGDKVINDVDAKDRDIAMVFQSYALYPHYTVYDNLAFGLRARQQAKRAKGVVSFLMTLFFLIFAGLYAVISWLLGFLIPDSFSLLFSAGIMGAIVILYVFPETRQDIQDLVLNFASPKSKQVKIYLEQEADIKKKVLNTAQLLSIESQLWKKPKQLSGGQRQRVALGRAIIRNPKAFLMDEPLSNLDAKLRVQMRAELERLTKKLKVTTLYVTHDQIEAMTLSDRIVILNEGIANQIGTPEEVYNWPYNLFVAGFIGSPAMNFIKGQIINEIGNLMFRSKTFSYPVPERYHSSMQKYIERDLFLGIRPEHIELDSNLTSEGSLTAVVGVLEPIGSDTFVHIDFPDTTEFIAKVEGITKYKLDEKLNIKFKADQIHFFDDESTLRIDAKTIKMIESISRCSECNKIFQSELYSKSPSGHILICEHCGAQYKKK